MICGQTSGKPVQSRKNKEQWWWNKEVKQAIQEKKEALKCVEEASDEEKTRLKQKFREKKNAANKAAAKARDEKQLEWYKRMEEDGGHFIVKLARDRDRDSKYTIRTSAMKRSDGILVTGVKQVVSVWEEYFKKLLNLEGECEIEMMRELEVRTITEEEVEKTVK